MENHKSHIFDKKGKLISKKLSKFATRIERKRPALSLLKPRKINSSRAEIDRRPEPSLSSLRKAPRGMDRAGHGPTSSLPAIRPFRMPCTGRPGAEDKMALDGTSERRGCPLGQGSLSLGVADEGSSGSVSHLALLW